MKGTTKLANKSVHVMVDEKNTEEDKAGAAVADEGAEEASRRPAPRIRPKNIKELFLDAIPERSRIASSNLRSHLTCKIAFEIKSSGARYIVDWTNEELKTAENSRDEASCTIVISESDLMKIVSGDLNPQIAMLSHKVAISGSPDPAVYAFNLIAPPANI